MGKGLKVLFWNIRSIYNKIDSVRHEINEQQPDIVNINETWLNDTISDNEINITGYNLMRLDRGRDEFGTIKRGGGICTYIKNGLICNNLPDFDIIDKNIELSTIKYHLPHTRDIYVLNVYRPPNGDIDVFIECLQNCVSELRDIRSCDIFIGGDMNVDILKSNSPYSKKIAKFVKLNQFKQIINTTTRPDSNTCLDLIITNCEIVLESGTLNISISDHLPVYLIRKKGKFHKLKVNFTGRSYKNIEYQQISDMLNNHDWDDFALNDIDMCWELMHSKIMAVTDTLCPLKEFKFSKDKPIWLTHDLINLMKNRDESLKQYAKTKTEEDKIKMRKARNSTNIAVKAARADYIKEQLETQRNDPKKFWKNISEVIPNKKSNNQNYTNIHDENRNIIPQNLLASHINCFFSDIGIKLDRTIPDVPEAQHNDEAYINIRPIERFECIREEDLLKEINKIPIYKSSGLKNLPSYILKLCFKALSKQLLIIINKSLYNGYFPKAWRKAIVVPIPKISIPEEIGDLRPIALTPLPGKIIERFVHTQLTAHLDTHHILTEEQNGFRKKHSTIDTIFRYTTDLQMNKNNKVNTISLYVDFKKAFDTVNHKLLLRKLQNYGIKNLALDWVRTYLTNRTQQTQIGADLSNEREVKTGVPQGSILGPTFFLCYINDIIKVCRNSKILLYADDTVLYKIISDSHRFLDMHDFQQDVNRLITWCQQNRLSINVKKTKLVFHPHSQTIVNDIHSDIKILDTPVNYVTSYLYLGVDIDNLLTFKKFYSNCFRKISYKLLLLRRIRHMLTVKAALDVTKTMLCSIIDYGNIFLSSCIGNDLSDIQTLQNHALRCCHNVYDYRAEHIDYLHDISNVKTVNIRRKRQILTCIWRNIQNNVLEIAVPIRHTRAAGGPTIYLPIPSIELFKKSVYYYGATMWNQLPINIRLQDNISDFKTELYKHIL